MDPKPEETPPAKGVMISPTVAKGCVYGLFGLISAFGYLDFDQSFGQMDARFSEILKNQESQKSEFEMKLETSHKKLEAKMDEISKNYKGDLEGLELRVESNHQKVWSQAEKNQDRLIQLESRLGDLKSGQEKLNEAAQMRYRVWEDAFREWAERQTKRKN